MARPLRIEFPGAIYHVTSRGNARRTIFRDDADRRLFLATLGGAIERFRWLCHAYCLMGNHYHLLIETPDGGLSRGMRHLNGVYTQAFNHRHERVGHLFQGRFKSILVDREAYLLELCRYVVLNPVRAKIVRRGEEWPWSSYRGTVGLDPPEPWLSTDWLLSQFGTRRGWARRRYREFVREGIGRPSPWRDLRGGVLLGTDAFVERLRPVLDDKAELAEVPKAQRLAHRPTLAKVLIVGGSGAAARASRDRAIRRAYMDHGYTLAEIGRHVGLHYATVSRIVKRTDFGGARNKT